MPSPRNRLSLEPLEPLILLADFYVSATFGNDDWDGSPTHPWATITHALSENALEGSEDEPINIHVAAGTYDGGIVYNCLSRWTNILGGYLPDYQSGDWSDRDPVNRDPDSPYRTVISGGGSDRGIEFHGPLLIDTETLLSGLVFEDCDAPLGGAIMAFNTALTVEDCSFVSNVSTFYGGGAIYSDTDLTVLNSVFVSNQAVETAPDGGAIYAAGTTYVANSLFWDNSAEGAGGAIYNDDDLTVVNSTFADNSAALGGGAIYNDGDLTLVNSILWDNHTDSSTLDDELCTELGATSTVRKSIVQGADADDWNPILNPRFEGTNVLDTDPLYLDPDNGDFHLLGTSPAIDAGEDPGDLTTDLDGNPRVFGPAADLGCYEDQASLSGPWVTDQSPADEATAPISYLDVTFSEAVDPATFTTDDVAISGPGGAIAPSSVTQLTATTFRVAFPQQLTPGDYAFALGPDILDLEGNPMNQDRDAANGEGGEDAYEGAFTLLPFDPGPRVVAQDPSGPLDSPIHTLDLTFSEEIDPESFTIADVSLSGPGGAITPTAITQVNDTTFRVTFPWQVAIGDYDVVVGPNVLDLEGNPMNQDDDFANGEAGQDAYAGAFSIESIAVDFLLLDYHEYDEGIGVAIYDFDLSNGISEPNIAWTPAAYRSGTTDIVVSPGRSDGILDRIALYGDGSRTSDLGIVVEGNDALRRFDDRRSEPQGFACLASEGGIASIRLRSPLTGAPLNGFATEGGLTLPADLDSDGDTTDTTGIWTAGDLAYLYTTADLGAEVVVGGSLGRLYCRGSLDTELTVAGSIRSLHVLGNWGGKLAAEWLRTATARGVLSADITLTGSDDRDVSLGYLRAARVATANLTAPAGLRTIRVGEWLGGTIQANWISTLITRASTIAGASGDFGADITLSGPGPRDRTLRYARIGGDLNDATWDITGDVSTIFISGSVDGWTLGVHSQVRLLRLGDVAGADITVEGQIGTLAARRFAAGSVHADSIRTLTTTGDRRNGIPGDFGADITLDGLLLDEGYPTLRYARIAGTVTGGTWSIEGDARTIRVNQSSPDWNVAVAGQVRTLYCRGVLSGTWAADSLRTLIVGDSAQNFSLTLDQDVEDGLYALRYARIRNWLADSVILADGHIGSVILGGVSDSVIFAGVGSTADENADGVFDLPDPAADFAAEAAISRITVTGRATDGNGHSTVNSNFAGSEVRRVSLAGVATDNAGTPFGLAAASLYRLTIRTDVGTSTWTAPAHPIAVDDFHAELA